MALRISLKRLNQAFSERVREISGQNVFKCIQCGNCSASCPMTEDMDVLPRKIARMVQLGLRTRLERIDMYWVCASCLNCHVVCPRGIDLPAVMEALRLLTSRRNVDRLTPSAIPLDTLKECPPIALVAALRKMTS